MNKKVDVQRKRKPEKKHKGESRYRQSTNGKVKKRRTTGGIITGEKLGFKEKRQEKGEKKDVWKETYIQCLFFNAGHRDLHAKKFRVC
jgi:hypothetical protein